MGKGMSKQTKQDIKCAIHSGQCKKVNYEPNMENYEDNDNTKITLITLGSIVGLIIILVVWLYWKDKKHVNRNVYKY